MQKIMKIIKNIIKKIGKTYINSVIDLYQMDSEQLYNDYTRY